jgi:integrase
MPKAPQVPSYRLHKARRLAVVTLDGKAHYLGPYGSPKSHALYKKLTGEWLQKQDFPTTPATPHFGRSFTIGELALAYGKFAAGYYVKNGHPTSQIHTENAGMRALVAQGEFEQAADFGPVNLKGVQQRLIGKGYARGTINEMVAAIKRAFKWATSEELIPATVFHALQSVGGLKKGRSSARETAPILPVADSTVDQTVKHLSPVVTAMVRLQQRTGMRPGEVCILRPCDVTIQTDGVWVYRPATHKTEHHDRERRIYIGPEGQEILRPFMDREPEAFCFSSRESMVWHRERHKKDRKTKFYASRQRRQRKSSPLWVPGDRFTTASYHRAIERGCEAAFGFPDELRNAPINHEETDDEKALRLKRAAAWRKANCWNPNQLRHSAATLIRERFGIEGAQVALGHSDPRITTIYAERNFELAAKIMQQIG